MEFVHRPYRQGETIAAIATPLGEGGIAIVRISGASALDVGAQIFTGPVKKYLTHTAHFGCVIDKNRRKIDEALLLVMHGKRSYTGEDTVEIQCHGGTIAAKNVLQAAIDAGARVAHPGEFTFKAFMNGKIDLAQAEAVQSLIAAKNERAYHLSHQVLEGRLSTKVAAFQERLVRLAAILEAAVDFPDEGLEFATVAEVEEELSALGKELERLLSTFQDGRKIHSGIHLCIAGSPNVGKSSLMNALLEKERAIVTPIAGTTRDVIEEDLTLNGLHFRLFDTAGIRSTDDIVESEGILRAHSAMEKADLVLLVFDVTRQLTIEEEKLLSAADPQRTIVIWNKIDLSHISQPLQLPHVVHLSVVEKIGIEDLKAKIDRVIWSVGAPEKEELLLSSQRHKEAFGTALKAIDAVLNGLQEGVSPEFLVFDLRAALFELGTIVGTNVSDDILSSIFSQFCIGK